MNGTDWAYSVLVDIALEYSSEYVKERASQFRPEVLQECVGMALYDIDCHNLVATRYAYETVRDVCMKLTRRTDESDNQNECE